MGKERRGRKKNRNTDHDIVKTTQRENSDERCDNTREWEVRKQSEARWAGGDRDDEESKDRLRRNPVRSGLMT